MMGKIIKHKIHYLTRFPFWLFVIILFSLSPLIVGFVGAWFIEAQTGQPCHEGNCGWAAMPWLSLITLPIGGLVLLVYLLIVLWDTIAIFKEK